ncbi:hypothetical protein PROFUN_07411 [Planoprotostelium fungivorum]|uniref:Serine/threonine-protein kinase RIO1 n=1 Tax=Planoprotostelium fungivorum TaxID=1890364 RepID=A0A2P6MTH6_9EUKA|nr:hypothetical protein PROFUN_07411 [Planoprotostelium fungivorum]
MNSHLDAPPTQEEIEAASNEVLEYERWLAEQKHKPASIEESLEDVTFADDDDGDSDYEDDYLQFEIGDFSANSGKGVVSSHSLNLNTAKMGGASKMSGAATNQAKEQQKKNEQKKVRTTDKSDRATSEQVLDPRTRMILFKFLNQGIMDELNGCLSTGKEANVYHGKTKEGEERAVKVYKTSILVFKDRDRYVTGEFRFRRGYAKHNPRKMVKVWAEKEMRNLNRLKQADIPCPTPITLRNHVLVMSFIGKDGLPAPKLKDAQLSEDRLRECYLQCIQLMRRMYHQCKLVHADLSEYNILYYKKSLIFIDVSQSVEHDHPHALNFLRSDCTNITDFFNKRGVDVMRTKQLFDFITDPTINDSNVDAYLEKIQEDISQRGDMTNEEKVDQEVFKNVYIPRTLGELGPETAERDLKAAEQGKLKNEKDRIMYQTVTGLKDDLTGTKTVPTLLEKKTVAPKYEKPKKKNTKKEKEEESETSSSEEETTDDDEESGDESDDEEGKEKEWVEREEDKEDPEEKKARKKAVKEANREKRKHKVSKYVKKTKKKGTTTKKK